MKHLQFLKNKFLLFLFLFYFTNLIAQIEVVVNAENDFLDKYSTQIIFLSDDLKDKMNLVEGFNVICKGFPLTQVDVSVNGGSFEQTGIFIDNVKFNDPQTGHYNLDVPFTVLDIEKINYINRGTTLLGDGALNGLLNIKLKETKDNKFEFLSEYGTYNTLTTAIRLSRKIEDVGFSISTEKSFSDGYHYDTDFDKQTLFLTGNYKIIKGQIGYDEKKYGAYDYYTPYKNLPSYEYVITRYGKIEAEVIDGLKLASYIRTHSDRFTLNRDFPSYYQNQHLNMIYGGILNYDLYIDPYKNIFLKYDFVREEINSNRLGKHHKVKNSLLINGVFNFFENLNADISISFQNYNLSNFYDLLPSMNIIYNINDNLSFNTYYSYSIRYPNFTELYYSDPYNNGNDQLFAEKSNEIGISGDFKIFAASINSNIFYKNTFDLIDWSKENISDTKWQIKNIGKVVTSGCNLKIGYAIFDFLKIIASYSYLNLYRSEEYTSKYGLFYLKNKLSLISEINIFEIIFTGEYIFKNYIERYDSANIINLKIEKNINEHLKLSANIDNLLNYYFEEIKGIPAPGRIISGMVKLEF